MGVSVSVYPRYTFDFSALTLLDGRHEWHLTTNKLNVGILMAVVSLELSTSKTSFHHCYLHHNEVQYSSPFWCRPCRPIHVVLEYLLAVKRGWWWWWLSTLRSTGLWYLGEYEQTDLWKQSSPRWLMLPNLPCTTSNSLLVHRGDNLWFLWNYKFPGNSPQTMFLGILLTTISARTAIAF